jgi:hypothetical protein
VPLQLLLTSTPAELPDRILAEGTRLASLSEVAQQAAAAGSVVLPALHGGPAFAARVVSELGRAGAALAAPPAEALQLAGDKWVAPPCLLARPLARAAARADCCAARSQVAALWHPS